MCKEKIITCGNPLPPFPHQFHNIRKIQTRQSLLLRYRYILLVGDGALDVPQKRTDSHGQSTDWPQNDTGQGPGKRIPRLRLRNDSLICYVTGR